MMYTLLGRWTNTCRPFTKDLFSTSSFFRQTWAYTDLVTKWVLEILRESAGMIVGSSVSETGRVGAERGGDRCANQRQGQALGQMLHNMVT